MPTFPALGCPRYGSYQESGPTRHLVETQMEVGRPKVRRRSSMALRTISADYAVTRDQIATFEDWHRDTIGGGVEVFDWPDPRTGANRAVRFTRDGGYRISQITPRRWLLSVSLEEWA